MKISKPFILVIAMMTLLVDLVHAQKLPPLDPSPADIAYLREAGRRSAPVIKVVYGRPQKKGRTMLGGTEPYGKVWRTGANETTEIKLYRDVTFGDKLIPAGIYSMYTIPDKSEWTLIFNSKLDTWGAFEYDESKDVARIKFPAGKSDSEVEAFTIAFDGEKGTGTMMLAWENTLIKIPLKF
ncbi:MAG TPA: DUF2911 domain-containing protein [Cyclobacteriaceae bacterium]|nr:DUF2911 domain-containing protein [Cyclobacteriaceae bacterium]